MRPLLSRFLLILLGFAAAVLIGALGASLVLCVQDSGPFQGERFFPFAGLAVVLTALLSFAPAMVFVMAAEHFRLRQPWLYAGFAMLTGAALGGFFLQHSLSLLLGLIFGALSGFAYWMIAGRNAGVLKGAGKGGALIALLGFAAVAELGIWYGVS